MVVSEKPFIPPEQQYSSQISTTGATGQMKATQPIEASGALTATRPVEDPVLLERFSQDVLHFVAVSGASTSGQPEVQPAATSFRSTSLTRVPAPSDEPVSDEEHLSDHASPSLDEEGELSDTQSTGPDHEDVLDVDQELSAEHTYRETICGVRSFMGWNQVPEFDSASSS